MLAQVWGRHGHKVLNINYRYYMIRRTTLWAAELMQKYVLKAAAVTRIGSRQQNFLGSIYNDI